MENSTDKFIELLKPEYSNALKYCKALCSRRSKDDAEDVLQQSLLKALENFDSLSDQSKFKSWFFKIITREFYTLIRKDFWKKFLPTDDRNSHTAFPEIFQHQDENCDGMLLKKALSSISTKERESILLFEIAGFSIEEIKEIQNERSSSSVKSRLSRARKKLKSFIENEENNLPNTEINKSNYSGDINNETIRLLPETEGK
ncbi:MAG: RNA polymerase sigma factor [Ignavibacteria bacterium]|nr:RNA polymerase sigma factor [Ignavibacteria bacterium]